ncbi:MAG: hypothetical protein R2865_02810 [Deinococcales bacterium]
MRAKRHQEPGWHHIRQVWEVCGRDYPLIDMPYYELVYENKPDILATISPEVVVVGNSNIGFEFNRHNSLAKWRQYGYG